MTFSLKNGGSRVSIDAQQEAQGFFIAIVGHQEHEWNPHVHRFEWKRSWVLISPTVAFEMPEIVRRTSVDNVTSKRESNISSESSTTSYTVA